MQHTKQFNSRMRLARGRAPDLLGHSAALRRTPLGGFPCHVPPLPPLLRSSSMLPAPFYRPPRSVSFLSLPSSAVLLPARPGITLTSSCRFHSFPSLWQGQGKENRANGGEEDFAEKPTTAEALSEYVRALPPQVEQFTRRRPTKKASWEDPMSWDQRVQQLLAYRREMNDFAPPAKSEYYPGLARWLLKQQSQQYLKKLDKDKEAQLAAIGVPWLGDECRRTIYWWEHFEELKHFAKRFGHTRVPKLWEENVPLANWVRGQRALFCARRLSFEQIHALDKLKFEWKTAAWSWNKNLDLLRSFQRQYGPVSIYKWKPAHADERLRAWLKSGQARTARRHLKLQRLAEQTEAKKTGATTSDDNDDEGEDDDDDDDNNNNNDINEEDGGDRYEDDIVDYKPSWEDLMSQIHVDDGRQEASGGYAVGVGVGGGGGGVEDDEESQEDGLAVGTSGRQRAAARTRLSQAGLDEELMQRELEREKKEVKMLQHWCTFQRKLYHSGRLRQVRLDTLRELGFQFGTPHAQVSPIWWARLQEAADLLKANPLLHGVPRANPRLYAWINNTRNRHRTGHLLPAQRAAVEEAGILLTRKNLWDRRFAQLQEFQRTYGRARPSRGHDRALWKWVCTQRYDQAVGRLAPEREDALRTGLPLGFVWRTAKNTK